MANRTKPPNLVELFDLNIGDTAAIVGGGGKTSLMFALASQFNGTVITTTTTRIFRKQMDLAPTTHSIDPAADPNSFDFDLVNEKLDLYGHCLVYGEVAGEKAHGVPPHIPRLLMEKTNAELIVVEADGSRMRSIKAPADHEPAVPASATVVIPTMGIDAFGQRVVDAAHRPELVAKITNLSKEDLLTAEALATILTHPEGGLKNLPANARAVPFINKVESDSQLQSAREIASLVLEKERISRVILGSLRENDKKMEVHRPVAAVVLAAGKSERMGLTKQLLPWGDRSVIGQTLVNLQRSSINDILVVTGHEAEAVQAAAGVFSVPTIFNPDYEEGEMLTSLQTAVRWLPTKISAVLVMLADQPMVSSEIIDLLLERYWQGDTELIAPVYQGKRGNPVLIGRRFFRELLALKPGLAPRHLLNQHPDKLVLVEANSPAVLQDLDRPEDYERWRPDF